MRSLVRRLTLRQEEGRKSFALGLINKDGKPAWEDFSQEEIHAFRRHVYEKLQYRNQQDRTPGEGNLPASPGPR